jgi:hypothetical protein
MQHVFEAQFLEIRSTMLFSDDYLVIIKLSSLAVSKTKCNTWSGIGMMDCFMVDGR